MQVDLQRVQIKHDGARSFTPLKVETVQPPEWTTGLLLL